MKITCGLTVLLDQTEDDLAALKWHAHDSGRGRHYATRTSRPRPDGARTTIYLHRIVLERILGRALRDGETADHVSGDRMDNRRQNLRLATQGQNNMNVSLKSNNRSGHKGVSFDKTRGSWRATISVNGRYVNLGRYPTPEGAALAYQSAATELHGEFARLK